MRLGSPKMAMALFGAVALVLSGTGTAQARVPHSPPPPIVPTISLVSQSTSGGLGNGASSRLQISGDGDFAVFQSTARNLVSNDQVQHGTEVFEANLMTGAITDISVSPTGGAENGPSTLPSVSANGTYVAFASSASNLVPGGTTGDKNVFLRDMVTGVTTQVSLTPSGGQPQGASTRPSISANGQYITYDSNATDLVQPSIAKTGFTQIYLYNTATGVTTLESLGTNGQPGNGPSLRASISSDGTEVAFVSGATNLIPNDTSKYRNIFEIDLATGVISLVSVSDTGGASNGPSDNSTRPSISSDGQYVGFESEATDVVPGVTNNDWQAYVRDTVNNTTTLVSVTPTGQPGDASSTRPAVNATGQYVAYESNAHDIVPKDRNHERDVFLRDTVNDTNTLVSVALGGDGAGSNGLSLRPSISASGSEILFASQGSNLVSQGGNGDQQIYLATFTTMP